MKLQSYLSQKNLATFEKRVEPSLKKIGIYTYNVLDKIGKGYSSCVYKGLNTQSNEHVAVKVINTQNMDSEINRVLLKREIEALKDLKHPNILKCFDIYTSDNNTYIITEYCETDLAYLIKKKKKISQAQSLRYFEGVLRGYQYMRSKGYIHRDFKPANILIKNGIAKIADFGFSKRIGDDKQKQSYNVGSPLYMPPQSLKGNIYSEKSDVWSLGILLYEIIFGKTPFYAESEQLLFNQIVTKELDRDDRIISRKTWDVIVSCLKKEEIARASVSQLLDKINTQPSQSMKIIEVSQTDEDLMRIDKVIQNELHYIIFLRQLFNKLRNAKSVDTRLISYLIMYNIKAKVRKLKKIKTQNVFGLIEWNKFDKNENYGKYLHSIDNLDKYYQNYVVEVPKTDQRRFNSIISPDFQQTQGFLVNYQYYLRKFISEFKQQIEDNFQISNIQKCRESVLVLDFTLCGYQLNSVNIENYDDAYQFSRQSTLSQIVNSKLEYTAQSWENLQQKLSALEF